MQWIKIYKTYLIVLCIISILASLAIMGYVSSDFRLQNTKIWQLGLMMLPLVLGASGFLLLIYYAWFESAINNISTILKKCLFWFITGLCFGVFSQLYWELIFQA